MSTLVEQIQQRAFERCIPLNATLELTLTCNLRCRHCYNFDRRDGNAPSDSVTLGIEEIVEVLKALRTAGTLNLSFTGGEPLAHPEFFAFFDAAVEQGFAVTVLTNGLLLSESVVDKLAACPTLSRVSVSLYGASSASYEQFTGMADGFERAVAGLRRLRDAGIDRKVKLVVTRLNVGEIPAMLEIADEVGGSIGIDLTVTPRYDGDSGPLDLRVDEDMLRDLYGGDLREFLGERRECGDAWACACARSNVAITSAGDVYPCIAVPWKAGNLREQAFAEIWNDSDVFRQLRSYRLKDYTDCVDCAVRGSCQRSHGAAFLASGSYTGIDPWVCRDAEIRSEMQI